MSGWCGQALEVDLTTGQSTVLPLSHNVLQQTLGGRGLAGYLLRKTSRFTDTPVLSLASGPFCGAEIQTGDRLVAVFRSPLTQGIFSSSSGCSFAVAMRKAGFDALVLFGEASELSHLQIDAAGGHLVGAPELAGLDTAQTQVALGDSAALLIGPAGENKVHFASVIASDGEPLARGGLGAVFGQMKLKALSARGVSALSFERNPAIDRAKADIQRLFHASPYLYGPHGIGMCGTAALLDLTQARHMLPTANFRQTTLAAADRFSAAQLKQQAGYGKNACPGCAIGCRKKDANGSLPEYDSLAHFSALLGLESLPDVIASERSCSLFGLDPVSTAVVLAAWFADNSLSSSVENVQQTVAQIARRLGAGAALANGLRSYIEGSASSQVEFCSKGLELPAFDPRGAYGLALSLAVSTSGEYQHAQAYFHELLRKPVATDRFSLAGKARIIAQAEDSIAVCDSLAVCRHTLAAAGLEEYAALLSALTGDVFSVAQLVKSGRQIVLQERWMNQQFGFSAIDDQLPDFFFRNAGSHASAVSIMPLDPVAFTAERARYYKLRGLDDYGHLNEPPSEPLPVPL